jgi:hypothetical protein
VHTADLSALGKFPDIPMKKFICIIAPIADSSAFSGYSDTQIKK